jgi:peptidoglycan/xylan/chitin deacetylase (PgdA/CDA1 family)
MKRRYFIQTTVFSSLAFSFFSCVGHQKTHILTLSFDDGFKKSFYRIAEIHEVYDLKACLNVIASAHLNHDELLDEYQTEPVGDFNDWNMLKKRGHEIMPHSWAHHNLTEMPFDKATGLIDKCLEYFEKNLEGFETSKAIYNYAYNASTPELDNYLLKKVRAVRTGNWLIDEKRKVNPFPSETGPFRLGCDSYGPENADEWVEKEIKAFLNRPGGWLILNLHGLDDEGWGPVSANFLNHLLKKLVIIDYLDILPTGMVLEKYA